MTDRLAEHDQADLTAMLDAFDALTGEAKVRLMDFPAIYWKLSRLAARRYAREQIARKLGAAVMTDRPVKSGGHCWVRTVPTDGLWCNRCGLAYARWCGDECSGKGAAEFVEQKLIAARARVTELEAEKGVPHEL